MLSFHSRSYRFELFRRSFHSLSSCVLFVVQALVSKFRILSCVASIHSFSAYFSSLYFVCSKRDSSDDSTSTSKTTSQCIGLRSNSSLLFILKFCSLTICLNRFELSWVVLPCWGPFRIGHYVIARRYTRSCKQFNCSSQGFISSPWLAAISTRANKQFNSSRCSPQIWNSSILDKCKCKCNWYYFMTRPSW